MGYNTVLSFYKNKSVLLTGNTGFKGAWLTHILLNAGAKVAGYSLPAPTEPSLFEIIGLEDHKRLKQYYGDVRDLSNMKQVFDEVQPEIVFHLAAQPIVRDAYKNPVDTYSTNVMGTVNVLECVRTTNSVRSFLNVTTDKVYHNNEWQRGYVETDYLDGIDPYSNSKSCSELVTHSYRDSFFTPSNGVEPRVRISTARAGNVIGGGDFANDRIIPDCVRAVVAGKPVGVRNPYSTRPYQHVLEPLFAYLMIAKAQYEDAKYAGYYNVGPDDEDCISTGELVNMFCDKWGDGASWINQSEPNAPREANFLKLNCEKLKTTFGWQPHWHIDRAVDETIAWTKVWMQTKSASPDDMHALVCAEMDREINNYLTH